MIHSLTLRIVSFSMLSQYRIYARALGATGPGPQPFGGPNSVRKLFL